MAGTSRAAESNPNLFDVFINHRGPDVRNTFAAHLYAALKGAGLRPFLDSENIEHGRHVFISIGRAVKGSRVHMAIFSERYAESKHCLDELCMMLDIESRTDILPVFFHVDPADLRRVDRGPFAEGFRKHSEQETEEQISKWRDALLEISWYRGFRLDEVNGNEEELVRRILKAVRGLMDKFKIPIVPPVGRNGGGNPPGPPTPEPVVVPGTGTFNPGDGRLNILVLGNPESVEAVIDRICGAGTRQTAVTGHVNLRECSNASPPMCLYSHTQGINRNNFTDIRSFVEVRNKKWRREQVKALWVKEVNKCRGGRNQPALIPGSTLRLHAIWFACRNLSDLPNNLERPAITEKLCDLPVQILVVEQSSMTQDLDINFQQEFRKILIYGSDFFPNAHKAFMEKLILQVALDDGDLKGKLWRNCWAVKTRLEIGNAARIIREIRKELGSAGICVQKGVGGPTIRKQVSVSVAREFVLNFLCTYWDVPQDTLRRVLPSRTSSASSQPRGSERSTDAGIRPCNFVEFCLIVAAIILKYNASRPRNARSGSSLDQLSKTGAEECYNYHFASTSESQALDCDRMEFEAIRLFLERIFAFESSTGQDPRPAASAPVVRNSSISKIVKVFYPRWKPVPVA